MNQTFHNLFEIFSQIDVLLSFINKKGEKLFGTCWKISSKSAYFHQKLLKGSSQWANGSKK